MLKQQGNYLGGCDLPQNRAPLAHHLACIPLCAPPSSQLYDRWTTVKLVLLLIANGFPTQHA